jgi:hypothetical protein
MIKKTNSFIALLLLAATFNTHKTHTMKRVSENENQPAQSFNFTGLPSELRELIVLLLGAGSTAESVKEAGRAIKAFSLTSTELKNAINNPYNCLTIIKNLSKQFHCSDQEAAEALDTEEAKRRLNIQQQFCNICMQYNFDEQAFTILYEKYKGYVDLNFVFCTDRDEEEDSPGYERTLLMLAAVKDDCHLIQILLNLGADINKINSEGESALTVAIYYGHINSPECLLKNTKIAIDQQNNEGDTALLTAALQSNDLIIELLLNAGADPTIANYEGLTPLQAAEQTHDQETIDLIQDAIDRKHKKQGK